MSLFRKHIALTWLVVVPCLVAVAGAFPTASFAQANSATLSGTLVDSSGGVLPGVTVTCKNIRTGRTVETITNAAGIFRFSDLPIGQYDLTSTLEGFQTMVRPGINLITGQSLDLKLAMSPGGVETTITVTGEVPVTQTSSSTVQTSMTVRQVQELPLNGRNPLQLVALTAGASITSPGASVAGQQDNQAITVNGLRSTQNNFRLDGSNYNNRFFGSAPVLPNPDTLEEFTVQSANYSARTAGAGALVELSTRSGSNQLRGSAFEFLRDKSMNANDPFNNAAGREKPPFKMHQYGGTIGGPIFKNKTFYFGAYQGTRRDSAPGTSSVRSLTSDERNGNFSTFTGTIIDPTTGQAFPGNIVPANRIDSTVKQLLNDMLPLPNSGLNLVSPISQNLEDDQFMARLDHELSTLNRLTVRYYYDNNKFQRPFNAPPGFYADNNFKNQAFLVRDSHIFGSNLVMTFQGSYSKFQRIQEPVAPGLKTIQDYGVKAPQSIKTDFFPGVRFMANPLFTLFSGGGLEQTPSTWDFHTTAIWSKGRHNLQFGADMQIDHLYVLDASFTVGTWTYNGSRTGYLPADIMMGLPSSFVQDSGRTIELNEKKYHFYVQDDWKVNDRLTVNAGLRWEPWTPPTDKLNNLVGFVKGQQSTVAPDAPLGMVYPGDAGIPESLFSNNWGLFAPRIGAAYDVFGNAKTVVRGGYGIFYIDPALTIYTRTVSTQPSVLTVSLTNPHSFMDPYNGVVGGNPYPFTRRDPSEFGAFTYVRPVSGGVLDPTNNKGYSQNWNLTFEQQLPYNTSLSVAYVGNKGTDILAAMELNPAIYAPGATTGTTNARRTYAGMSAMEIATPYQRSQYHSLQVTATKRAANGLTVLTNYVFSKTMDNASQTVEGGGSYPRVSSNPDLDWGPADFDVRHRGTLSFVYDLPFKVDGAASRFVNDWQVNGILVLRSGLPFQVWSGTDRSLTAVNRDFADLTGDPARPSGANPVLQWFNTAAFAPAALGTVGNMGRNSLRGPRSANFDFAVFKNIPVTGRVRVQFRAESFNLLNRVNYNNPNSTITAGANFGRILGAADPRVIQLGLKLLF